MKKLAGFAVLFVILLASASVCSAESGIGLVWEGNANATGEVASNDAFPFKATANGNGFDLIDDAAGISASIEIDTMNPLTVQKLRDYYNDYTSSEDQLFDKFVGIHRSYIPALKDLYRNSFLFGDQDDPLSETDMKLFYQGSDTVFDKESAIYLYGIFHSDGLDSQEETHLDLSVPSPDTHSLVSISITLKNGVLNGDSINLITELLNSVRIGGMSAQTERLAIFSDKNILDAANAGVYPAMSSDPPADEQGGKIQSLIDFQAGYVLFYPSDFIPFMQNNLGGNIHYKSFKIDPYHIFSITSKPLENGSGPEDAVKKDEAMVGPDSVTGQGALKIGGKIFDYINYDVKNSGGTVHFSDYFITVNSMLYRLQLLSRLDKPSASLLGDFNKILTFFSTFGPVKAKVSNATALAGYTNAWEGYGFSYPENWELTNISDDTGYDSFKLAMPELSGPLDVTISEGEFNDKASPEDISALISDLTTGSPDSGIKHYRPPYEGSPSRLLDLSFSIDGESIIVHRQMDYLDTNGRNRLLYCTDIVKGTKIYSMFVAVGEYETVDGSIVDKDVDTAVNAIISSFHSVNP